MKYLIYVRKFSISTGKTELYVYSTDADDVFHVMGEMMYRMDTQIERITFQKLTPENKEAKLAYWKEQNMEIKPWCNKY